MTFINSFRLPTITNSVPARMTAESRFQTVLHHRFATTRIIWIWNVKIVSTITLIATSASQFVSKLQHIFMSTKMEEKNKTWASFWTLYSRQETMIKYQAQVTAIGIYMKMVNKNVLNTVVFPLMVRGHSASNASIKWKRKLKLKLRRKDGHSLKSRESKSKLLLHFIKVSLNSQRTRWEVYQVGSAWL